jgi:hypothetical protein
MTEEHPSIGSAQWTFIKKIRASVKNDSKAFVAEHNWRNVSPRGGKNDSMLFCGSKTTTVDAFYVRSMALWVPHLLIANHVPTCPRCKDNENVDVIKARWINSPKVLYGVTSHKYLDTMLYPCAKCCRTFSGYNKQALQLDANIVFGYFNYYLGHGYAVDEDLYRLIVDEACTQSTASISQRLNVVPPRLQSH